LNREEPEVLAQIVAKKQNQNADSAEKEDLCGYFKEKPAQIRQICVTPALHRTQ
jgi:hypothetical protein